MFDEMCVTASSTGLPGISQDTCIYVVVIQQRKAVIKEK